MSHRTIINIYTMGIRDLADVAATIRVMHKSNMVSYRTTAREAQISPQTVVNGATNGNISMDAFLKICRARGYKLKLEVVTE